MIFQIIDILRSGQRVSAKNFKEKNDLWQLSDNKNYYLTQFCEVFVVFFSFLKSLICFAFFSNSKQMFNFV